MNKKLQVQKVGEMITRWIASCLNETQLDICDNAIENCLAAKGVWEEPDEEIDALVADLKGKVSHKRHALTDFPGATLPLPGATYEETEK